jgi:FdhD protein
MSTKKINIKKIIGINVQEIEDIVAIEEPLEISLKFTLNGTFSKKVVSVTMRTPGNDSELAVGFLFTEGIISTYNQVQKVEVNKFDSNKITVTLIDNIAPTINNLDRNFYTTSSCGVCGKTSIEAIETKCNFITDDKLIFENNLLFSLQEKLLQQQTLFKQTGGIHASALFDTHGEILAFREDVGRHNALDKLIGWGLSQNLIPINNAILLLSGRASFELIQKAAMAGIKVVVAVGAPSSLAIETAQKFNMQLIGFLKTDKYNVYS